jgi:hypothetical protein
LPVADGISREVRSRSLLGTWPLSYACRMDTDRTRTISPIIDHLHPAATDAEKVQLTVDLRIHLAALYRWYCRLDAEGLLDADSPEFEDDDRLGVSKIPCL